MNISTLSLFRRPVLWAALFSALGLLQACGSGSGADTVQNQDTSQGGSDSFVYQGPAPQTEDVQNFKLSVYDNLVEDRCGTCHGVDQAPLFVSRNDVNLAYQETNTNGLVNLSQPSLSRLVEKVAEGHNCWTDNDQVCADILTNYLESWASNSGSQQNLIVLTEPEIKDPGSSKAFPADSALFASTVYGLLESFCSDCHSETGTIQQQPYFASSDIDTAYAAAKARMDLANPANSRFVIRLGAEFHNCWSDCTANADAVEQAIADFAGDIEPTTVEDDLVISKAQSLFDGVVASSGGRIETNVVALYEFKTGEGYVAYDTSGVDPAADLNISGDVSWVGSWGIRLNGGKAQAATSASAKIYDAITSTGEYSVEAWVVPANVTQEGPARIVNYSGADDERNFGLGQTLYNYNFQNRTTVTDADGNPMVSTPDADEVLQATLQHVVVTYDPVNGRQIFVNGESVGEFDSDTGGNFTDWNASYALVVGNEVTGNFPWIGTVRLLAIHNRALEEEDIRTNYDAGVGEKYYLLFSVSEQIDIDQAYIVFEVQQFDDYSYLFNQPFFYVFSGDGTSVSPVDLEGMRIGINGKEANQGQAYANLVTTLGGSDYEAGGQVLSSLGTVIAIENGADVDEFFLTFDQLGGNSYTRSDDTSIVTVTPEDTEWSAIGIKTFEEIDASLSAITGIPRTNSSISEAFARIKQQLPTSPDIQGFLAAHQMGVTQLAVEYCNELTSPANGSRATYFPGFDFNQSASTAFDVTGRGQITTPLLEHMVAHELGGTEGSELEDQADPDEVLSEMDDLFDTMVASCGGSCDTDDTRNTVTAVCAAVTGSALMLIQ